MLYHKKLGRIIRSTSTRRGVAPIAVAHSKSAPIVQGTWQLQADRRELQRTVAYSVNYSLQKPHNKFDESLKAYADKNELKQPNQPPLRSLPFDESTAISGNLWHNGDRYYLAIKGAPELVIAMSDLTENEREKATMELRKLEVKGLNIIAFAHCNLSYPPKTMQDIYNESMEFDGFITLIA